MKSVPANAFKINWDTLTEWITQSTETFEHDDDNHLKSLVILAVNNLPIAEYLEDNKFRFELFMWIRDHITYWEDTNKKEILDMIDVSHFINAFSHSPGLKFHYDDEIENTCTYKSNKFCCFNYICVRFIKEMENKNSINRLSIMHMYPKLVEYHSGNSLELLGTVIRQST